MNERSKHQSATESRSRQLIRIDRSMRRQLITVVAVALLAGACAGSDEEQTLPTEANGRETTTTRQVSPVTTTAAATSTTTQSASTTDHGALLFAAANMLSDESRIPVYGGTDLPNDEPYDSVFFDNYGVNPRIDTEDDRFSTFAVDVDTGSYTIGRRYLRDGNLPDKDSVRVEEYVNYFRQQYAPPDSGSFAIHIDGGPTPFVENDRYHMIRIGLQSWVSEDDNRPPANLTFVIDVSGSMGRENRLELVKDALLLLVDQLEPTDQVGIVIYGSRGEVVLHPTAVEPGMGRTNIVSAIRGLTSGGSTNAAQGLELAYGLARDAFSPDAINRVILASDGVANVGESGPGSILERIGDEARTGIQLVTVGFGMGNYNDVLMEQIANDGDGFYAYVDDIREAERLFVHDLTGTLVTVAKDAKVQVEFNPDVVERWRLVGFENRAIADEDFRDDTIDAGEIGSGHSVTALYEVKLVEGVSLGEGVATVYLRWADPDDGDVVEISEEMLIAALAPTYEETLPRFQLAATVATYAEVLRDSYWAQGVELDAVASEADRLAELLEDADVTEFASLVNRAASLDA